MIISNQVSIKTKRLKNLKSSKYLPESLHLKKRYSTKTSLKKGWDKDFSKTQLIQYLVKKLEETQLQEWN